jgi:hypothetical protein
MISNKYSIPRQLLAYVENFQANSQFLFFFFFLVARSRQQHMSVFASLGNSFGGNEPTYSNNSGFNDGQEWQDDDWGEDQSFYAEEPEESWQPPPKPAAKKAAPKQPSLRVNKAAANRLIRHAINKAISINMGSFISSVIFLSGILGLKCDLFFKQFKNHDHGLVGGTCWAALLPPFHRVADNAKL